MTEQKPDITLLVAQIVAAYVAHNKLERAELPALIRDVHGSLLKLNETGSSASAIGNDRLEPAVPIRKSVTPEYLICLEDGRKLKTLKRHLKTAYNMTPDAYRARWHLPPDYPMVAPSYARQRSKLAKDIGLGHRRG